MYFLLGQHDVLVYNDFVDKYLHIYHVLYIANIASSVWVTVKYKSYPHWQNSMIVNVFSYLQEQAVNSFSFNGNWLIAPLGSLKENEQIVILKWKSGRLG